MIHAGASTAASAAAPPVGPLLEALTMPYSRFHSTMPSVRAKPPAANTAERLLRQTKIPMANASAAARQNTAAPGQCRSATLHTRSLKVLP